MPRVKKLQKIPFFSKHPQTHRHLHKTFNQAHKFNRTSTHHHHHQQPHITTNMGTDAPGGGGGGGGGNLRLEKSEGAPPSYPPISSDTTTEIPFVNVDKNQLTEEVIEKRGWGMDTAVWEWSGEEEGGSGGGGGGGGGEGKVKGRVNPREIKKHGRLLENEKQVKNSKATDDDIFSRHQRLKAMGKKKPKRETQGGEGREGREGREGGKGGKDSLEPQTGSSERPTLDNNETGNDNVLGSEVREEKKEPKEETKEEGRRDSFDEDWEVIETDGSSPFISLPKVVVYKHHTPLSNERLERIQNVFEGKGMEKGEEVKVVDVANDYEMQSFLSEMGGGEGKVCYPVISICGHLVYGEEALMKLGEETGGIEQYLQGMGGRNCEGDKGNGDDENGDGGNHNDDDNNNNNDNNDDIDSNSHLELGNFDKMLGAGETLANGMGSIISLPFSLLWSSPPETKQVKKEGEEFKVIHTNWYYRRLHRIFRFEEDKISRLHPDHRDVR